MKNSIKIPMDIKEMISGIGEIEEGAEKIFNVPKSDSDKNLYKEIYDLFYTYDDESAAHFKDLMFDNNENIESLNDLAQQVLISYSIISYLLKLKSENNKITLLDVVSSIKYGSERKDWLFLMKERVIPYMAVNKLI